MTIKLDAHFYEQEKGYWFDHQKVIKFIKRFSTRRTLKEFRHWEKSPTVTFSFQDKNVITMFHEDIITKDEAKAHLWVIEI